MPTPDESKILKIIEAEGGECTIGIIAKKERLDTSYVRLILNAMGRNDLIDIFISGKVRITSNGWMALWKKPQRVSDGLKRYLKDRAKWKTF